MDRPAGGGRGGDGLQDRGQEDDGGCRRAGARRARPRDGDGRSAACADQGVGRRRWPRHAGGPPTNRTASASGGARREAQSAFGDPTVFCERYLATGHHVEVQVLADDHGTVWAVGERECSIQRRHQKIIEEAPSPLVERTEGMRAKLFDAARLAATAIGYTGAGTVEFMADDRWRLLLPRDEHPAAGRASGHRGHHRPGPRRAATACRRRRPARSRTAAVAGLLD